MTTAHAIKKLERAGFQPITDGTDHIQTIVIGKTVLGADNRPHRHSLRVTIRDGKAIIISTGRSDEENAGRTYWDNLTQALRHW